MTLLERGAAVRALAPQPIVQACFMLFYAVWWVPAWPVIGTAAFLIALAYAAAIMVLARRDIRLASRFAAARTERGAQIGRRMGVLSAVSYGLLWVVVAVLAVTGGWRWILPAATLIIGLHFLPLAWIFERRIDFLLAPVAIASAGAGLWLAATPEVDWRIVAGVTGIGGAVATGAYAAYLRRSTRTLLAPLG